MSGRKSGSDRSPEKRAPARPSAEEEAPSSSDERDRDVVLDESLEESFPASDPPAHRADLAPPARPA